MFKNVASQKFICFAFDSTTNLPKTGDAANITAYVSKDFGSVTVLADTSATEMDATNAKGYYLFDLAQAETNADTLLFSAKSSTANVVVVGAPAAVFTAPANFTATSIDASGRVDVGKNLGHAMVLDANFLPGVNVVDVGGAAAVLGVGNLASGTAQAGASTTITLAAGDAAVTSQYVGCLITTTGGTGANQCRAILANDGTTKVVTVDRAWATNPDATTAYAISPNSYAIIASNVKKNQALAGFPFSMKDSTTHLLKPLVSVTAARSLGGAAFGACANAAAEVSDGGYKIDLAASDLNANTVRLKFTGAGCDVTMIDIITQP